MALWLADFTGGIADRTGSYRKLGSFALGEKLYRHFRARTAKELAPGDEYGLIDDFADMLKMRDRYVWIDDPGEAAEDTRVKSTPDADADARPEGSTNPELLRSLSPAASMHMLAALERFHALPLFKRQTDRVRDCRDGHVRTRLRLAREEDIASTPFSTSISAALS